MTDSAVVERPGLEDVAEEGDMLAGAGSTTLEPGSWELSGERGAQGAEGGDDLRSVSRVEAECVHLTFRKQVSYSSWCMTYDIFPVDVVNSSGLAVTDSRCNLFPVFI